MSSLTASTRQPPAGGPGGAPRLDGLVTELRRGEREAFVRYFQLLRAPVFDFVRRLLDDETEAVATTTAAFVAAFRLVLLDRNVTDLGVVTFRCAFEACLDRVSASGAGSAGEPAVRAEAPRPRPSGPGDASRRTAAALGSLSLRRRASLLLHDRCGFDLSQSALVFAMSEEAAGALLFRAREEFRRTFEDRSAASRAGTCRQAEQAAAGAVGLGLDDDAVRRLRRHAAYCRPCRAVVETWRGGAVGLAVLLGPWPLPEALDAAPIFGAIAEPADRAAVAGAGRPGGGLRSLGHLLRGRAVAYAVAAACVALAAGVALHDGRTRTFIFAESVGPAIRLVVQPSAHVAQRTGRAAPSQTPRPAPARAQSASLSPEAVSTVQVASVPAASASSREGAAADSGARRKAASKDTRSADSSGAREAAKDAPASRAGRRATAQRSPHGIGHGGSTNHDGTRLRGARHQGAGHSGARRNGHHAWRDRGAHGRHHSARPSHEARGDGQHGRSHASRGSSQAVHSRGSGGQHGHGHAKKNH